VEAAGGSVMVTFPEPDHEQKSCEMIAKLREGRMGRELDCRETVCEREREGVLGFCLREETEK